MTPSRNRLGQLCLVDYPAAGDIDQTHRRFRLQQQVAIDESGGLSASSGRWIVKKSASATAWSSDSLDPHLPCPVGRHERIVGNDVHAVRLALDRRRVCRCDRGRLRRGSCRRARHPPTAIVPNDLPSTPRAALGMLRAWASSSAIVCSAAETMLLCGALTTITPCRVAASTSTLSRPIPARPITSNSSACSSSSAVIWVAERMMMAFVQPGHEVDLCSSISTRPCRTTFRGAPRPSSSVRRPKSPRSCWKQADRAPRRSGGPGFGLDNVDVQAAMRRGVMVVNAPAVQRVSAAEHTMALLFAQARNIPQADRDVDGRSLGPHPVGGRRARRQDPWHRRPRSRRHARRRSVPRRSGCTSLPTTPS